MTAPLAGQIVRASDARYVTLLTKLASESVTSSTTLQDDDDFAINLGVGTWRVVILLNATGLSSTTSGGLRTAWTTTGTMTSTGRMCRGPGFGSTDMSAAAGASTFRASAHNLGTNVAYGALGGSTAVIEEDITIAVTVAGILQLQWAQQVSNATATNVTTGSRCFVHQVDP